MQAPAAGGSFSCAYVQVIIFPFMAFVRICACCVRYARNRNALGQKGTGLSGGPISNGVWARKCQGADATVRTLTFLPRPRCPGVTRIQATLARSTARSQSRIRNRRGMTNFYFLSALDSGKAHFCAFPQKQHGRQVMPSVLLFYLMLPKTMVWRQNRTVMRK